MGKGLVRGGLLPITTVRAVRDLLDMDSSLEAPPLSASASASGLPWQGLFGLRSTLRGAETLDS